MPGGHLDVLATLQLKTNPRVFVAGDVVGLPEQHTLIKATAHAPIVVANIRTLVEANGKPTKALKRYTKAIDSILVTNGRVRLSFLRSPQCVLISLTDARFDVR